MKTKRQAAALLAALMMIAAVPQAGAAEAAPAAGTEQTWESSLESVDLDSWNMLLVNPWNYLPEGFTVELVKLSNGLQVDKRVAEDLNAMLDGCRQAGLRPLVCSAYRSYATQQRLHNNKIARLRNSGWNWADAPREAARWVAVPGTSEHQTGMAVDIVASSYQVLNKRQESTAEQKWLMEHCWEYGFILRYPSEKSDITGIGYEPWHYRYVGREIAQDIRASGLCLEEYIEVLRAAQAAKAPQAGGSPVVEKLPVKTEADGTVVMDGQTDKHSAAAPR
ncbi:MAG: M15 family metallopeptidase [Oscillibacter sp.]|nr:M15 family metallopeptidase [Oscillibacter sp.]